MTPGARRLAPAELEDEPGLGSEAAGGWLSRARLAPRLVMALRERAYATHFSRSACKPLFSSARRLFSWLRCSNSCCTFSVMGPRETVRANSCLQVKTCCLTSSALLAPGHSLRYSL